MTAFFVNTRRFRTRVLSSYFLVMAALIHQGSFAQKVGVGTANPLRMFSVNGSIMLDQGNKNDDELDSAALVFGSIGSVGITSKKTPGGNVNGLNFWTGTQKRLSISNLGHVGIGPLTSPSYRLWVQDGNSYFDGNISAEKSVRTSQSVAIGGNVDTLYRLRVWDGNTRLGGDVHATGNAAIGGDVDADYKLRVWGGNTRLGGDMYATGKAAIGGAVDDNFRFRVHNGNSQFGGDVAVTGSLNTNNLQVANNLTIGGKGSVRSNGATPLKIHFTSVFVDHSFSGSGQLAVYAVNLPDFDNIDDVRLSVSHFEAILPIGYNPQHLLAYFSDIDPVQNKAVLVLRSIASHNFHIGGTYYITAFLKDN